MEALPVPSSHLSQRKEWRVISEHHFRNNGEEPEHVKFGQTDERTIYEVQEGGGPVNIDLCSNNVDGEGMKEDILQLRVQEISRQREELEHMEIELRAQAIIRSEIMKIHKHYRSQLKEHTEAAAKLKEQLQEREKKVSELELNLEAKTRELHAVKIDNEAVWAKEDLFREQNKELATFRRDRDISEAERGQHLKKIHDLQEHLQEKENQFLALEEQYRVAQETILYKDEQLREMQAWISRIQEADALQSTTNQSLQAELRERTEQFNQYWIASQRQFVEMEHHHLQTIQQLHLELADARVRNGLYQGNSQVVCENQTDPSLYLQTKDNQANANDGTVFNNSLTFGSDGKFQASSSSTHIEPVAVVPTIPGMGGFLAGGQITTLQHPFVMHQPGVPESVPSSTSIIPQSCTGHFQSTSAIPVKHWQNQEEREGKSQAPNQEKYHMSQLESNLLTFHSHRNHELPATENVLHPEYLSSHINNQAISVPAISMSNEQLKIHEFKDKSYQVSQEIQGTSIATSTLHAPLFEPTEQKNEQKVQDQNAESEINGSQQALNSTHPWSTSSLAACAAPRLRVGGNIVEECTQAFPEASVPVTGASISMSTNKTMEPVLLDEKALLACIVRAIPAGSNGRIRISTTLPNRLGKMLAPLHWHDYKKHYGKLDDFVACHPELFAVEGDYIHLCEGAQEIISATAAVAKVAAAAASYTTYSSTFPSVAVTPISQGNRLRKAFSNDSKHVNSASSLKDVAFNNNGISSDKYSQVRVTHSQQKNGLCINVVQGLADISLSSTSSGEKNDSTSIMPSDQLNTNRLTGNGSNKAFTYGRIAFGAKKQERASEAKAITR